MGAVGGADGGGGDGVGRIEHAVAVGGFVELHGNAGQDGVVAAQAVAGDVGVGMAADAAQLHDGGFNGLGQSAGAAALVVCAAVVDGDDRVAAHRERTGGEDRVVAADGGSAEQRAHAARSDFEEIDRARD